MNYIGAITRSMFKGDFQAYPTAQRWIVREFPSLDDYLLTQATLSKRIDIERYVLNVLIPRIEQDGHIADYREWLFLMSTWVLGPP